MDYDYSELLEIAKNIVEIFKEVIEGINRFVQDIRTYLVELLKEYKSVEKTKHKPVREIRPNKTTLLNKRLNRHYCRSNL